MSKAIPYKRTPCKNCPFRTDCLQGWLGKDRAEEISQADSFTCHKTDKSMQCAGHMAVLKNDNGFFRLMGRLGMKDDLTELIHKSEKLVFKSTKQFVKHHTWDNKKSKVNS